MLFSFSNLKWGLKPHLPHTGSAPGWKRDFMYLHESLEVEKASSIKIHVKEVPKRLTG